METKLWILPYGLPIIFNSVSIFLLLFIFNNDSVEFLVEKGEESKHEALTAISRVYYTKDQAELEELYDEIKEIQVRAAGNR